MNLLERERYLDELDGLLREAAAGQGRLALVGGEGGVGKTALVGRFCGAAKGRARVLVGACDPLSTPRPLAPLQDIAAATGGELDRLLEQNAPRDRLFRACLAELGAGLTPTLAVVEDAHWADEATLDLLRFLGRRVGGTRALLVVTYRDDEVGPAHPLRLVLGDLATAEAVRRLSLTPLSEGAVRTLAAGSGSRLDPVELHRLTGGNPFFVTEVLAVGQPGLPATVRDAVLARASRLSPPARALLDAAAVIGPAAETELLGEVAATEIEAIDECLASGVLRPAEAGCAFRHELAREAILGAISSPRRVALHAQVLRALEAGPTSGHDPARLAHHAEAAGDRQAVLEYAPLAARQAAVLRAHREAAAQHARALRFAGDLPAPDRAGLEEAHAYECYLTDRHEAAIAARRQALAIWRAEGEPVKVGENLRWISRLSWFLGQHDQAMTAAHEAIAVLSATESTAQLAWAYSNLAQLLMLSSEYQAAAGWAERALALAEEAGEREVVVHALNNLGSALWMDGDARGQAHLERSLQLALELGLEEHVARAWTNLASGAFANLQIADSDRYVQEGIAYATEHDLDAWRLFLIAGRADTHFFRGDWSAATDDAAWLLRQPALPLVTRVPALTALGRVRIRRGDPGGDEALAEALALADPAGELQFVAPIRAARAEAADLAGDRRRTAEEVRAIDALDDQHGLAWLRGERAYWLWRAGESVEDLGHVPGPFAMQIAGDWRGAAAAWDELGCPYEAARARAEGDDEAELRAALATFERLGARPMAGLAARRLRELGARAIPRGPRPTTRANPANLTPREVEVLAHLAAGCRNAEITERLYLSPKTVDHHVSAVLAKLGVRARGDAAAAAARLGLPIPVPARTAQDREGPLPR